MTASPGPTPAGDAAERRSEHDAASLVRRAAHRGVTLGTAESLTGGAVASEIVTVPGASACFEGSVVSYSHAVKERVLGVPRELLAERGAVDPDVALAMARGARAALGVDWAVSTTGVAGPEPHDGHAVGTVFIGVSGPGCEHVERLQLNGDRARIRQLTVRRALDTLATQMPFPGHA
ncbi:CinA family protein [Kocuria sp.]|uniref:CinA family protein n=1 Tax=Kocuria sp. TaxID=1871328 RepID=UPI0026DD813D|nr:CinA family protein [Kocuria sp.]MDO4919546.1 CinA family protein [Kocuria sp.]